VIRDSSTDEKPFVRFKEGWTFLQRWCACCVHGTSEELDMECPVLKVGLDSRMPQEWDRVGGELYCTQYVEVGDGAQEP